MIYYFATTEDMGKKIILKPRIPESITLTGDSAENNKIKRICVSKSIHGCLLAISASISIDDIVYIYQCNKNQNEVIQPTINDVYDSPITGEEWLLTDTKFILFMKIKIIKEEKLIINEKFGTIFNFIYKEIK